MRTPPRSETDPFVVIRPRKIEGIIFLADAQFVAGFGDDGSLSDPRLLVCRVQRDRLLEVELRALPVSESGQRPAASHMQISSSWVKSYSDVEGPQGLFWLALAQIGCADAYPIVGTGLGHLQDLTKLLFRLRPLGHPL